MPRHLLQDCLLAYCGTDVPLCGVVVVLFGTPFGDCVAFGVCVVPVDGLTPVVDGVVVVEGVVVLPVVPTPAAPVVPLTADPVASAAPVEEGELPFTVLVPVEVLVPVDPVVPVSAGLLPFSPFGFVEVPEVGPTVVPV